ncbi:MAG: hypothetical protein ACLSHU_00890 [Oscillospiraceae bacterium]
MFDPYNYDEVLPSTVLQSRRRPHQATEEGQDGQHAVGPPGRFAWPGPVPAERGSRNHVCLWSRPAGKNQVMNLTAITDPEQVAKLHFGQPDPFSP